VGAYSVEARQIGFRAASAQVQMAAGQGAVADFRLAQEAVAIDQVVVTVGSRAAHTAADELAVPVDVFPVAELQAAGRVDMADVLQELSPAINFDRPQIADLTSGVRPFQMRGLSPDHSLVLINGKRRHPTAVVHVFGGAALGGGSSGVDMNAIPSQALGQMEILRDGAAAQYGSDAIAGVINMGLKSSVTPLSLQATYGLHTPGAFWGGQDGQRWDVSGNVGLPLPGRGSLNVTAQVSDRNQTNRACPDNRDQVAPGDADVVDRARCAVVEKRNDVRQPNFLYGDGEYRNYMGFLNAELPLAADGEGATLYGFGGLSLRQDLSAGNFRRAIQNVNWRTMYPEGFLPTFDASTRDITAVGGVRGLAVGWNYDVSAQLGQNRVDNDIVNSLNTSLGPCFKELGDAACAPGKDGILGNQDDPGIPNQTEFYSGSLELSQYSADFSASRTFDIGLAAPANVAWGATYRAENYRIIEGELASYVNGGHKNQDGGTGAAGSQVFFGYSPEQAVDEWRSNVGVFADLEADLTSQVLVALAGRYENYSDFGSTVTGKLAARYQPFEALILRAAASTGFRAPALSQSHYTHLSTTFRTMPDGQQLPIEIGEFPVTSPEAQALGAKPLKEETSTNYSAGFALTPFAGLNLTADFYLIQVDDRIMLSNSLNVNQSTPDGQRIIAELLAPYAVTDVKYFMNAFNTETTGMDLTASYQYLFGEDRLLQTSLSYNYNKQELVGEVVTPPVLAGMGTFLYPEDWRIATTKGRPKDRLNARVRYSMGPLSTQVAANYYGEITTLANENPYILQERRAKTIFDADLGYELRPGTEVTLGVENLFNVYPDRNLEGYDGGGRNPYSSAGWGRNGRYLYTRINVAF
jgi:iron complex outermembrane recepter protein